MPALWLRSVRRRPATAVGLYLIVAVACAAATAGPMLIRAAEQSGLRTRIARADPGYYDISVTAPTRDFPVPQVIAAVMRSASAASPTLFDRPVSVVRSQHAVRWRAAGGRPHTAIAASIGATGCARVTITTGRCPTRRGQVLVPDGSGAHIGDPVEFGTRQSGFDVVGSYRPSALPAWLTEVGPAPVLGLEQTVELVDSQPTVLARDHLHTGALELDTLSTATASFGAVRTARLSQSVVSNAASRLPALAGAVHRDERVTVVVGLITVVPLVVLCWYVLILVMQLIAVIRSREWALGRLRGLPVPTWLRSLYTEPLALLLAGAVSGVAAGTAVAALTARITMALGTPIEPWRLPVLVSVGGTVAGALVGIGVATLRGIRLPLATLLQQSAEPVRLSRTGAALHLLVLVGTVLAVVQLATQPQVTVGPGNVGLLVPGLLAALVGLVAIRWAARTARRHAGTPPRSVRALVVGRRLARNPGLLGRYLVVAVATAVTIFAVSLVVIMQRNVGERAVNELGAATVVHVAPVTPDTLLADVHKVDPDGHFAMAVEQLDGPTAGGTTRLVAVDSARLAAVSNWHAAWAGLDAAQVHQRLAPHHAAPVVLRGTSITMTITGASGATAGFDPAPQSPPPHPDLQIVVLSHEHWLTVSLGAVDLHAPRQSFTAALPCASGCLLRGIALKNPTNTLYAGTVTLSKLSTDTQPSTTFAAALTSTNAWQTTLVGASPGLPVNATPQGTPDGLELRFRDYSGMSSPGIQPADGPEILPAVLADGVSAVRLPAFGRAVDGAALDNSPIPVRVVGRAATLPSSVSDGALVDLRAAARFSDPSLSQASAQVWFSAAAPASALAALHSAGLKVVAVEHVHRVTDLLLGAAPVRAVVAGIAAVALLALLVAVALGSGVAIDAERRKAHVRVLRDAGLAPRTIRRLSFEDVALPSVAAIVVGAVAGVVGIVIAGPRLPLFASSAGPPLTTAPSWSLTGIVTAALIAVVLVFGAVLARVEFRAATRMPA